LERGWVGKGKRWERGQGRVGGHGEEGEVTGRRKKVGERKGKRGGRRGDGLCSRNI